MMLAVGRPFHRSRGVERTHPGKDRMSNANPIAVPAVGRLVAGLALVGAGLFVRPLHADGINLNASYWAEGSTDNSGNYYPFAPVATANGSSVLGFIPTDASSLNPSNDVVNYFRTSTTAVTAAGDPSAYGGVLLGDLSGYSFFTATFSLNDSALAPGAQFQASDIVGETYSGEVGSNAGIRLMFMGGTLSDGTPNEWWSDYAVAYVTSMFNGQDVTLTAAVDPSQWSNYYGTIGSSDTGEFYEALSGVTRFGLSLGSGYFFSDGFAFDTGGTAYLQLDGIGEAPEPATFGIMAAGLGALTALRRKKKRG